MPAVGRRYTAPPPAETPGRRGHPQRRAPYWGLPPSRSPHAPSGRHRDCLRRLRSSLEPFFSRHAAFLRPHRFFPPFFCCVANGEIYGRSLPGERVEPDLAAVALDHFLAEGQAETLAGMFVTQMQALEQLEQGCALPRVQADAVVPHGESPGGAVLLRRDVDLRRRVTAELERVVE